MAGVFSGAKIKIFGLASAVMLGAAVLSGAGVAFAQTADGGTLKDKIIEKIKPASPAPLPVSANDKKYISAPGVQAMIDVAYGTDARQKMDVFLPAKPAQAPILLMVHGGSWNTGHKSNVGVVDNKANFWIPKGYIVASVNYRLARGAVTPLTQAQDVASAMAYIQKNAATWGGDPKRVVLMGHSAGAHLVTLLAMNPKLAQAQGAQSWRGTVSLDSAVLDVVALMKDNRIGFYDRIFGKDAAFWPQVSPAHQVAKDATPTLFVCSTKRADSVCAQADALAAKLQKQGTTATVLRQAMSQGAVNFNVGLPGDYTDAINDFLKSVL